MIQQAFVSHRTVDRAHRAEEGTLDASLSALWRVLADYAQVHAWNRSVTASHSTNSLGSGLGAQRYCKMAPASSLMETTTQWRPQELLTVRIDKSFLIPIRTALVDYARARGAGFGGRVRRGLAEALGL